jgi:hypothetical protein
VGFTQPPIPTQRSNRLIFVITPNASPLPLSLPFFVVIPQGSAFSLSVASTGKIVISTEAAHRLVVSNAVENHHSPTTTAPLLSRSCGEGINDSIKRTLHITILPLIVTTASSNKKVSIPAKRGIHHDSRNELKHVHHAARHH